MFDLLILEVGNVQILGLTTLVIYLGVSFILHVLFYEEALRRFFKTCDITYSNYLLVISGWEMLMFELTPNHHHE